MRTRGVLVLARGRRGDRAAAGRRRRALVLARRLPAHAGGDDRRRPTTSPSRCSMSRSLSCSSLGLIVVRPPRAIRVARRARCCALGGVAVAGAAVLYLVFLGLWGLNYRRVPLEHKLDYEPSRVTRERRDRAGQHRGRRHEPRLRRRARGRPPTRRRSSGRSRTCSVTLGARRDGGSGRPEAVAADAGTSAGPAIDGMTNPVLPRDHRQPRRARRRAAVRARARVGAPGRLCRRIGGELRRLADLPARRRRSRSTVDGCRRTNMQLGRCRARTGGP